MNDGRMSRRSFLAGGVSLVAAAGATALLVACAPRQEAPAASTAAGSAGTQDVASAAASASAAEAAESGASRSVKVPRDAKVLLVYFSRPGQNNDGMGTGKYRDLATGYTKTVAGYMLDELKCDSFEIQAADPYPHDYSETVKRNVQEERNETYPEIANLSELESIDGYDVIIMGSPVWNSQSPMIMRTFLKSFDFSGKIILPFTTYDMSELGSVPEDYARLAPNAQVSDAGLAVYECDAEKAAGRRQVHKWLAGLGLVKS